ncbi:MAG: sigma-70 family RNA polymerase sigma factor [Acidobacteriota bacterium]
MTSTQTGDRTPGRAIFDERFGEIEKAVATVARAHGLGSDEAGELYGDVMVKVVDRDYAVLREFGGRCRWSTYLYVVARRVLLDRRARRWGRWRPSAAARRLGPMAVALDRRLNRDGLDLAEAVADVRPAAPAGVDLEALAAQIPRRLPKARVDVETVLDTHAGPDGAAERVEAAERGRAAVEVRRAVYAGLGALPEEERELLTLRFGRGYTVRRIARDGRLPERRLYARFQKIFRDLRRRLEAQGVGWNRVAVALEADGGLRCPEERESIFWADGGEGPGVEFSAKQGPGRRGWL